MPTAENQSPCAILGTLQSFEARLLNRLFSKWSALQRLGLLLEEAGDLSKLIPNPAYLIPLNAIDLDLYNRLRANCPMLGLPEADLGALDDFRQMVENAYYQLLKDLNNHPWARLGDLDANLSDFLKRLQPIRGWARCLNSLCDAFGSEDAEAYQIIKKQYDEIVSTPGTVKSVISATGQGKVNQLRETTSQVQNLLGGSTGS